MKGSNLLIRTTSLLALFCAIMMGLTNNLFAQSGATGVIEGRVLNADRKPEENVVVSLSPSDKLVGTSDDGHYEFRNVPYGTYTISIKSLGVSAKTITVEVSDKKVKAEDIILKEEADELERVIVSSSYRHVNKNSDQVARMPMDYIENPQNYAVVPKVLLEDQLATTTEQALVNVPGVSNLSVVGGSGGSSLTFRSRGFANGSVILRNGVSSGYVTLTDLFNVERIEAIKGPGGTLFGGNESASYGGVYNMITRQPLEVRRGELSFTTGSYEMARTTIDYNTPLNEDKTALLRVSGVYDSRNTFQNLSQQTVGFAPSLQVQATDRLKLNFDGYYYKSVRPVVLFGYNIPPGVTGQTTSVPSTVEELGLDPKNPYFTTDLNGEQQTIWASGKADYTISHDWHSQTLFSVSRSNNNTPYITLRINKPTTDATTSIVRSITDIPHSYLATQQFQQNFIGDFKIGSLRNRMVIGFDYFRTSVESYRASLSYDQISVDATGAALIINSARVDSLRSNAKYSYSNDATNSYGLYVSDALNITDRLLLMGSLRVNRFEQVSADYKQTSLSPKIGLSYQIIPQVLSVYGNYNNGYRNVGSKDSAMHLLKPEYANQLEGGIKFDLFQNRLTGTLSVYDIKVKNIARQVTNEDYYVQDNTQKSRGVDIDILATPVTGLNIAMGYGYNDIRYTEDRGNVGFLNNRVECSPYNTGNIWASYQFTAGSLKGLGFGAGGNGQSSTYINNLNTITLDGFAVAGASVFYNALKFRITAKLDNIANKKYYTYNSWMLPGQPRMLSFNVTYRF